ncbi:MAG: hypothetical protein RMX96_26635 [Nostoc sp. ChiSLP02]|nr:hypothetical protein [Nostoc sp. DedSLP05]MDZ8102346.1 hypothetical protein [Nostoc sp. DedSLP01]MDZ8188421.1 hypothetical protein [Nostoc sp. ChiSLP02]
MEAPRLSSYRQSLVTAFEIFAFMCILKIYFTFGFSSFTLQTVLLTALIVTGVAIILGLVSADYIYQREIKKYREQQALRYLISEIQKHCHIIKAIDIKDQLEDAGNKPIAPENRQKVVEALQLTRADLIRALKTEKILRTNKDFILQHPDTFTSNLAAVKALQITEQASEWGQLLNQTLEVAVEVKEEMRKLQAGN